MSTVFNFTTPMTDYNSGKEILNPTQEELEEIGIIKDMTDDQGKNAEINKNNEQIMKDNFEKLRKYTVGMALNQIFDQTQLKSNSDFAIYAELLKKIRIAESKNDTAIEVMEEEIKRLKKIFEVPPKPQLNRHVAFILECLNKTHAELLA